ncbi:hypothetical protein B0H10DRAFT_1959160 [Mycena sp. CBHHK59/15]|nr:hypothetical protein B0H10DRAFT_1959160 [Mycena sp. CBHHK59/15]
MTQEAPFTSSPQPPAAHLAGTHFLRYSLNKAYIALMEDTDTLDAPANVEQEASDNFKLAEALLTECKAASNISELNTAIYLFYQAAYTWLPEHPELPGCLNQLAEALVTRFSYAPDLTDVQLALALRGGVLGGDVKSVFADMLMEEFDFLPMEPEEALETLRLASSILTDFQRSVDLATLTTTIFLYRTVLSLQGASDPNRWRSLCQLSDALLIRFRLTGENKDWHESISLLRELHRLQPNRVACLCAAILTAPETQRILEAGKLIGTIWDQILGEVSAVWKSLRP